MVTLVYILFTSLRKVFAYQSSAHDREIEEKTTTAISRISLGQILKSLAVEM
jgi:hypothetical protein